MEFFVLNFQKFMLVFSRIMGMVLVAPFFSSETIPSRAKLGLALLLSFIVFPMVRALLPDIPGSPISYAMLGLTEGLIGVTIGFCLTLAFSVFQLAGQYFTVQMGFGASEVFDPMSQISLPLMGQYLYLIAILVFLSLQGPMIVIKEVFLSFELVNVSNILKAPLLESRYGLIAMFSKMFLIALRMSMPIMGTLLLVSVTMGLLAKAAPQMNLLMIGFPISITVAFLLLILIVPNLIFFFREFIDEMFKDLWFMMMEISNG